MAKYLFPCLLIFLLGYDCRAQTTSSYRVVRIVGYVESSILKRGLQIEDVVQDGDKLKFKGKEDYLIIFHPKTGRKKIQGVPDDHPRELNVLLQSFLKPDHPVSASRGIGYMAELESSLKDKVLLLGECTIELDPTYFLIKAPATIKAQYKPDGVNKVTVVVLKGQTIHLDKKTLFPSAHAPTPKVLLLYFLEESSEPLLAENFLGNFVPVYVEDNVVIPEVKSISKALTGSPADTVKKYISQYLAQEYAKPQPINLEAWLKSHHLLPDR